MQPAQKTAWLIGNVGPKAIMEKQLSEFVSAGFLVTREVDRPSYVSAELLPARIVSASGCIARFAPNTWCIEWTRDTRERRIEDARAFGLEFQDLQEIIAWTTSRFGKSIRWPNVITDLNTSKDLVSRFFSHLSNVKVLELCLHRSMSQDFCQEAEPPPPKPGFAPNGRQGVQEVILKEKPPIPTGRILGFELLVFDFSLSCSWLCNGLETQVEQDLGIKPNQYGLIDSFDKAFRCVEYISRDDVGAEPGLWLPWLIIDHTETVRLRH
ncbi:MAG: hypothetical protein JSW26_24985 [Desulfobacterales bacterium]|nr:MAG: hypothetical protein JSW26_24985 [Desulfobacterales bacterium]